jgi:hypothetical protein
VVGDGPVRAGFARAGARADGNSRSRRGFHRGSRRSSIRRCRATGSAASRGWKNRRAVPMSAPAGGTQVVRAVGATGWGTRIAAPCKPSHAAASDGANPMVSLRNSCPPATGSGWHSPRRDGRIGLMDPRLYCRLATPRPSAGWNANPKTRSRKTWNPKTWNPNSWNPNRNLVFSTACLRRCDRVAPSFAISSFAISSGFA